MRLSVITAGILSVSFLLQAFGAENRRGDVAKVYCKSDFIKFKNGENAYGWDSGGLAFKRIPGDYSNFRISICKPSSQTPLKFKVKEAGAVYLVVQEKDGEQVLIDKGWKQVDTAARMDKNGAPLPLLILYKHLEEGEYELPNCGWYGTHILKK